LIGHRNFASPTLRSVDRIYPRLLPDASPLLPPCPGPDGSVA
jgi:hypothetical protein